MQLADNEFNVYCNLLLQRINESIEYEISQTVYTINSPVNMKRLLLLLLSDCHLGAYAALVLLEVVYWLLLQSTTF